MVRMTEFVDRHKGKRFWVCGTGPSLLDVDVSMLTDDDVVIACNSARLHFGHPHYWLMVDGTMDTCFFFHTAHSNQKIIILNELLKPKNGIIYRIYNQSSAWGDWGVYKDRHFPGNSTHRAVSFAYAMGARVIILAGCDCTGGHPYDPSHDTPELALRYIDNFKEDVVLWNAMIEHNPNLPIWTISQFGKTEIPSLTFEHALYL